MARYFFNLHENGDVVRDEEGRDLPSVDAAIAVAKAEARQLMAHDVLAGKLCLDCQIDIVNEQGERITRVPFREAVTVVRQHRVIQ